ncbi:hypothetical protein LXL04_004783 [Taraxacum kok-saghyz]
MGSMLADWFASSAFDHTLPLAMAIGTPFAETYVFFLVIEIRKRSKVKYEPDKTTRVQEIRNGSTSTWMVDRCYSSTFTSLIWVRFWVSNDHMVVISNPRVKLVTFLQIMLLSPILW